MKIAAAGDAFDGGDLAAFGFHTQHQAGGDDAAVEQDRAGAAITVVATLLGAGKRENVAQALEKALAWLAEKLGRLLVDGGSHVDFIRHVRWTPSPWPAPLRARAALIPRK